MVVVFAIKRIVAHENEAEYIKKPAQTTDAGGHQIDDSPANAIQVKLMNAQIAEEDAQNQRGSSRFHFFFGARDG